MEAKVITREALAKAKCQHCHDTGQVRQRNGWTGEWEREACTHCDAWRKGDGLEVGETMQRLFDKGCEYYMCAQHLHPRGAAGCLIEAKEIIKELKAEGKAFDDVLAAIERMQDGEPFDLASDPFMTKVKAFWDEV